MVRVQLSVCDIFLEGGFCVSKWLRKDNNSQLFMYLRVALSLPLHSSSLGHCSNLPSDSYAADSGQFTLRQYRSRSLAIK